MKLTSFYLLYQHFQNMGITVDNMWSVKNASDLLARIDTFCCDNLPGMRHELTAKKIATFGVGFKSHDCWGL